MNLLNTPGDIKLNECFRIPFTLSSLTLVKVKFDCSLIITLERPENCIFSPIIVLSSVTLKWYRVITGYARIRNLVLLKTNPQSIRKLGRRRERKMQFFPFTFHYS